MSKTVREGAPTLKVCEPPPRYRMRGGISPRHLARVAKQLEDGNWRSDDRGYKSRSAANYRAEILIDLLAEMGIPTRRRTWLDPDTRKWRWAIQRK